MSPPAGSILILQMLQKLAKKWEWLNTANTQKSRMTWLLQGVHVGMVLTSPIVRRAPGEQTQD